MRPTPATPTQRELQRALKAARLEGFGQVSWSPDRGFQFGMGRGASDGNTPPEVLDELKRHFGGKA